MMINRILPVLLAIALASPAVAQDETQAFNAFAVVAASGKIVRDTDKVVLVSANLAGPLFIETDEGPIHAGRVTCSASGPIDQASRKVMATGACTFTASDGATASGVWTCEGYELVGCRGTFRLGSGTGRLEGVSGDSTLLWRPSAHEFKKQLDGSVLDNATGILVWRDFKLKGK